MSNDILSLAYKNQIDAVCKILPNMGLKNFVMYLIFNDGNILILSNVYCILKPYYQDSLYREDYTYTSELIQPINEGYYLCNEQKSLSPNLKSLFAEKYNLHPIFNIVRKHPECTFVFSAVKDSPVDSAQIFYERTVKKFEDFCIRFLDEAVGLIIASNPAYRFSFVLNNKALRDAVIRQGYNDEIHLSVRQQECLWHAGLGKSAKEVAIALGISPYTVEQHLKQIREMFNCNKLPEIMLECIHRGIIGNVSLFNKKQTNLGRFHQVSRGDDQVA